MGFRKPNMEDAYSVLRNLIIEIRSPYNDGFSASGCKQELYQLKCWLEDQYDTLPTFVGEDEWEQERLVQILSKRNP